jgi:hypothetical protein
MPHPIPAPTATSKSNMKENSSYDLICFNPEAKERQGYRRFFISLEQPSPKFDQKP